MSVAVAVGVPSAQSLRLVIVLLSLLLHVHGTVLGHRLWSIQGNATITFSMAFQWLNG